MEHLLDYELVWMLNDDVEGVSGQMLGALERVPWTGVAAVTPAFNSPHGEFHPRRIGLASVSWVDWCCPVVNVKAWRDVGPFDERFKGYGADLDWCRRARDRGWRFFVHHDWQVHHLGSQTALKYRLQSQQGNVKEMNRLLIDKWGVDWTRMK